MSNLLTCQLLSKAFGAQQLFSNISFTINSGDRIGLIGPNGSGKSTLLKIICSLEEADTGRILRSKNLRLTYLPQTDVFDEQADACANLAASLDRFGLEELEKKNRIEEVLSRAEFSLSSEPVASLSGGQRKRLAICRAFLEEPDILVMDEPTNHLDIEGILWLEKTLLSGLIASPDAVLLVSHDRRFLQNCTNRTIELSALYPEGSLQVDGNYLSFLDAREQFMEQQLQEEERLENKMRRETEWLRRGAKARTTKAKYRIDEAYKLQNELSQVKFRNRTAKNIQIEFDATGRKTKKLLEAEHLGKSFSGTSLFSDLHMVLTPGKRLGLLGRNGCGKSTLLNILAAAGGEGDNLADSGTIRMADGVRIIHFDQKRTRFDAELTLRQALAPDGDAIVYRDRSIHVVSWAKKFLFRPDQLETPISKLSGGEMARIYLADLMKKKADILLLDEPTNDLDIPSLEVLEESLLDFPGALVLVSHDRSVLERVCDQILGFDGQGDAVYVADYEQWLDILPESVEQKRVAVKKTEKKPAENKVKKAAGRLSYLEQREYDQIEEQIFAAEELAAELEEKMKLPEVVADPQQLAECWEELQNAQQDVDRLYQRWHDLEEKKNMS